MNECAERRLLFAIFCSNMLFLFIFVCLIEKLSLKKKNTNYSGNAEMREKSEKMWIEYILSDGQNYQKFKNVGKKPWKPWIYEWKKAHHHKKSRKPKKNTSDFQAEIRWIDCCTIHFGSWPKPDRTPTESPWSFRLVSAYTWKRIVFGCDSSLWVSLSLSARYFAHVICAAISDTTGHLNVTFPFTMAVWFIGWPSEMYGRDG